MVTREGVKEGVGLGYYGPTDCLRTRRTTAESVSCLLGEREREIGREDVGRQLPKGG